jgi:hypothetical protein
MNSTLILSIEATTVIIAIHILENEMFLRGKDTKKHNNETA